MMRSNETYTAAEVADVFWDHLKPDPNHHDRVQTAWGSKTKLGLALTIRRLGLGLRIEQGNRTLIDSDEQGRPS